MRAFFAVLAAVNPPAAAIALGVQKRQVVMAAAAAITWVFSVVAAAASEALLDALDVTPETFRVAAGVVLGIVGARWLAFGARPLAIDDASDGWGRLLVPLLVPVLITPQLAMVSISAGADDGTIVVGVAAAISLVLAWAAATTEARATVWEAGVRFVGALAIAVALALAVDGIQAI
jgi:small neutral amino acid transporter SnatA (MarC family)